MKKFSLRDRGIPCFWVLGFVLLFGSYVTGYDEACPGGEAGRLERGMLETVMSWMPEELKNPDDICESRLGVGSSLCREEYDSNYSGICNVGVYCKDPLFDSCTAFSSYDGIQCGDQKWCYDGRCQYSQYAVTVQESCPFGDNRGFTRDGLSCDQLVTRDRKQCYDDVMQQTCCGSCAVAKLNLAGCEYGDSMTGCSRDECSFMTQTELSMCCQTCGFYTIIVPTRRPEVTVSPIVNIRTTPESTSPSKTTGTNTVQMTASATRSQPSTQDQTQTTTSIKTTSANTGSTPTTTSKPESTKQLTSTTKTTSTLKTSVKAETESTRSPTTTTTTPTTTSTVETSPSQPASTQTVKAAETTPDSGNVQGQMDSQQDTQNAVAIGTGVGVGSLVVIVVVVIIVYVIRKRMTSQGMSSSPGENGLDNDSIGGDSTTNLSTGMMGSSSRWYPGYRANHAFE